MIPTPPIPFCAVLPELILLAAGCAVLLLGHSARRNVGPGVTLVSLAAALALVIFSPERAAAGNGLLYGPLAQFVRISGLELGILLTLVNWSQARVGERGEFLALLLFSLCGLLLVGAANNLLILFLALELVSIPTYILVVLSRGSPRALEAGTKYFFLGALSAALIAYGFSFLYGVGGTAQLASSYNADGVLLSVGMVDKITSALASPHTLRFGLATLGIVLAIGGLLFKIAAVPLHFYVADVYQGAASPVAGLLGFVPKLAGFVAICKLVMLTGHWDSGENAVFWLLWFVAVFSMCVGNLLALRQSNIKRLLGYSGIAHAGYMLVGVLAGPLAGKAVATEGVGIFGNGVAAVLYYMVIYGLANLGAFAVLALLRVRDEPCETLRDVAGLVRRTPGLALLLVLAMFTLMGLPPTPGFWGKLSLFGSALTGAGLASSDGRDTAMIALVIIGVLNSALAAAYYLRVIAAVLLHENEHPARAVPGEAQQIGALLCGFLLLIFALFPNMLMQHATVATSDFIGRVGTAHQSALSAAPGWSAPPELAGNAHPTAPSLHSADADRHTTESAVPGRSEYPPH
jgi:NADH-quinone oxidoreductase subunit N